MVLRRAGTESLDDLVDGGAGALARGLDLGPRHRARDQGALVGQARVEGRPRRALHALEQAEAAFAGLLGRARRALRPLGRPRCSFTGGASGESKHGILTSTTPTWPSMPAWCIVGHSPACAEAQAFDDVDLPQRAAALHQRRLQPNDPWLGFLEAARDAAGRRGG
jgi:hypothetical protein